MAQQTAVEWLIEQLEKYHHQTEAMTLYAKQMEKEQIVKALTLGYLINKDEEVLFENAEKLGEQYYNETYKK